MVQERFTEMCIGEETMCTRLSGSCTTLILSCLCYAYETMRCLGRGALIMNKDGEL